MSAVVPEERLSFQRRIAEERRRSHDGDGYAVRVWNADSWVIGVAGEVAWCLVLGLDYQTVVRSDKPRGDGGVDFRYRGFSVDVKTRAGSADGLYCQIDGTQPTRADILALAEYDPMSEVARAVAWAWREDLLAEPIVERFGVRQHFKPTEFLRTIAELRRIPART